ncbi:MAG: hypothetical protein MRY83_12895, partial [Flavobacteriales bacterium]|nr:hypothetical protein [Flavobacteriales bacterium]
STGDYFESADEEEWMNYLSERDKSKTNNTKVSGDWKTIRFKQENVHDFAWFADKTWLVQKGEVELPHSKRKVTTWIMYQPDSKDTWEDAISYVNDAIYYYSLWNGDYPYNQMTAVDGALTAGGGMEYPNITVIGQTNNKFRLEQVIMHETGHQWFYGILGSNERIHPWMDEGINSFNESRYIETKYPDAHMLGLNDGKKILDKMDLKRPNRDTYYFSYLFSARNHRDQPMEFPAAEYTGTNYGTVVYMKSAVAFRHLKNYLGTEAFDSAMQEYFETWKFKHPSPKDLREVLEKSTGKDLSWFFEDMLLSTKPIDYKLKSVKEKEGSLSLSIKNKTGLVAPLCLSCVVSDTLALTKWEDGFTGSKTFQFSCPENTHKVRVNQFASLDINRGNNERRLNGLFKGVEPIKFQMAATIENGQKTQILYMPVAAWNNYNRWMLGAAFFNSRIPKQKFEYLFMPLYSFSTKDLNGIGKINYTFFSEDYNSLFHSIVIGANARRFANFNIDRTAFSYERYEPFINFVFNKPSERDINNHEIRLRNVIVNEDFGTKELNHYPELSYSLTRKHPLNPQSLKFRLQSAFLDDNSSFTRISIDAKQEIEYNKMGKLITVRAFAGKFITNETTHPRFNWRADGTMGAAFLGAYTDFNYDKLFLGRTETRGLLSQQFYEDQGGFKSFNPIGQSNDWIAALNLKIDLPIPLPLGFFTDFAVNSNNDFTYDFGVHCILLKDIIEVYVPLGYSKNLQEAIDLSGRSFGDQIRFVLNLPAMGPLQALDNLDF